MFALMTWNEYYREYLCQLQAVYSHEEASAITKIVFENKTNFTRKDLIISPDKIIPSDQKQILDNALKDLLDHKPVQQVTGEACFYDLKLKVNEHVLIPRPETEELVKWVLDENAGLVSILDIGSGSGCIPISLKHNLPGATITSIDISDKALLVAKQNAHENDTNIDFIQMDFLDKTCWQQLPQFDIIVSNPPYIPASEKLIMEKNVTLYEPHMALFVPDNKPLIFYDTICEFAKSHLRSNGAVYTEIHEDLAPGTSSIFSSVFKNVETRKDINGKDRMIKATHFR